MSNGTIIDIEQHGDGDEWNGDGVAHNETTVE